MKVVVAHHLWSRVGGGELVNAYIVKTLLGMKYDVIIVSTFGFNKKKYSEWFGIDLGDVKIYTLLPRALPLFGIYQRLSFFIPLAKAIKTEKPGLLIIDNELYRPILRLKKQYRFKILEYIHFPFHALRYEKGDVPREYREAFERYMGDAIKYYRKYNRGLWRYYFKIWLALYEKIARENPFESADVVVANSKYIARLTKILWEEDAMVLNPPVKVKDFKPYNNTPFEKRENSVIMIGRVAPEKRIEEVITAISNTETRPTLKIIGGLIPSTIPYKKFLERKAKEKGVKIEFYLNVTRDKLVKIASTSKVFVHATIGEHFGIAVVEGMAAGCPVIVHQSGGPYEDIIDFGNYGFYYSSIDDLVKYVDELMVNPKLWKEYHNKSLKRATEFSEENFVRRLINIIKDLVS